MANPFFRVGPQRAARVQDLFAAIARRYDLINDVQSLGLHRGWKRRVASMARVGPGDVAVDLCCGTGDVAFALVRGGASVVGVDFSPAMLAVARSRWARRAQPEAGRARTPADPGATFSPPAAGGACLFVQGDATCLPLPDGCANAVTISYGLRNLASLEAGLREMWRVAKPGGRIVVLDFGKPDQRMWRGLYFGYLRWCVPLWGRLVAGNGAAYSYILDSLRHYPGQQAVARGLRGLGATQLRVVHLLGGAMSLSYAEKP